MSPVHGANAVEIQENDLFVEKQHKNKEKNYLGIFSNKYKSKKKLTMGGTSKLDRVVSASVAECCYPPINNKKMDNEQQQQPAPSSHTPLTPHDFKVLAMLKKNTSATTSLPNINIKPSQYTTPIHINKRESKMIEEEQEENEKESKFNYDNNTINKLSKDNKRQPISLIYKESKELVETLHSSASDIIIRHNNKSKEEYEYRNNKVSKSQENSSSKSGNTIGVTPLKKLKPTKSGLMRIYLYIFIYIDPPIPPIPDISIVNTINNNNNNNNIFGRPMTAPGKSKSKTNNSSCSNNLLSSNGTYYLPENDPILIYLTNLRTLYSVIFGSTSKYSEKELFEKFESSKSCVLLIDTLDYINRIFDQWMNCINNIKNNKNKTELLLLSNPIQKYTFPNQNKFNYFTIKKIHRWINKARLNFLDGGVENKIGVIGINTIANRIWKLYQLFNEKYVIINNHLVSLSNNNNNNTKRNNNSSNQKKYIEYIFKIFSIDKMKDEVYEVIAYLRLKCEMNTQSYSKLKSHPVSPVDKDDQGGIPDLHDNTLIMNKHSPIKKPTMKENISLTKLKEKEEKKEEEKKEKKQEESKIEKKKEKSKIEKKQESKAEKKQEEMKVKNSRKQSLNVNTKVKPKKDTTPAATPISISPIKYNNNNIKIIKTILIDLIDQIIDNNKSDINIDPNSSPQLLSNLNKLKFSPSITSSQNTSNTTTTSTKSSSSSSSTNSTASSHYHSTDKSTMRSLTFSSDNNSPYYMSSPNLSFFNESPNSKMAKYMNDLSNNNSYIINSPALSASPTSSSYYDDEGYEEYYVLEDHKPVDSNELELKRGEIIRAKKNNNNDWWEAIDKSNKAGYVPRNFLEPMSKRNNDYLSFIEEEGSVMSRSTSVMSMDGITKRKSVKKKKEEKTKMDRIKEEES